MHSLHAAAHFTLPTLPCSFPVKLHRDYERVRTECDPWILGLAHPNVRQVLRDSLLPRYACRLFPAIPNVSRLKAATKFIGWLTLADDVVDPAPAQLALNPTHDEDIATHDREVRHFTNLPAPTLWAHRVLSKLKHPEDGHHTLLETAGRRDHDERQRLILLGALGELWRDVSSQITPRARARFIKTVEQHLEAVCLQQSLNSAFVPQQQLVEGRHCSTRALSIAEYMAIRRKSSGFLVGVELHHYALGLDEDLMMTLNGSPMEELQCLVVDYMCMCNDLVSCRMESAAGTYLNLPYIVYSNGMARSFQDAVETVVDMMERTDARCVQLVDAIRRDRHAELAEEPRLKAYLDNLVSCMSGTLRWSFETVRYGLQGTSCH